MARTLNLLLKQSLRFSSKQYFALFVFLLFIVFTLGGCADLTSEKKLKVGSIERVGNMIRPRSGHSAILLKNNKVLIVGGAGPHAPKESAGITNVTCCEIFKEAELYNLKTKKFEPAGALNIRRDYFTATLLHNGKVLIVGGRNIGGSNNSFSTASTEIYDPVLNKFLVGPDMLLARHEHHATLLPDGRVLISGGFHDERQPSPRYINNLEFYDPKTNRFTFAGTTPFPLPRHSAILLNNGKVLLTGGIDLAGRGYKSDIITYDAKTQAIQKVGNMANRGRPGLVKLNSGEILFIECLSRVECKAEIFNPDNQQLRSLPFAKQAPGNITILTDSSKLMFFGYPGIGRMDLAKRIRLYDPQSASSVDIGNMYGAHGCPSLTLLPNKSILISGGRYWDTYPEFAEIYSY